MKLTEDPGDDEHLRFTLTDKSPGTDLALVCQALNEELQQTWITHIKSLLDMQGHFLRGMSATDDYLMSCMHTCTVLSADSYEQHWHHQIRQTRACACISFQQ